MSWLAVLILIPLLVATARGRRPVWHLAAALLMLAALFDSRLGVAAVLWVAMLALALTA